MSAAADYLACVSEAHDGAGLSTIAGVWGWGRTSALRDAQLRITVRAEAEALRRHAVDERLAKLQPQLALKRSAHVAIKNEIRTLGRWVRMAQRAKGWAP